MSNTQSHLIVKEEGICIYRVPVQIDMEEVHLSGHSITDAEEHYDKLVKQAQSSAILCEDQIKAITILIEQGVKEEPPIGSIYPVPGIEFEEVEVPEYPIDHTSYPPMIKVARLIEHTADHP